MKRECAGIVLTAAGLLIAGSCTLDDRRVRVLDETLPLGGADAGGITAPRLAVSPEAVHLEWVTLGFPARSRIRVENTGAAPLAAPAVSFAPDSHADFSLIHDECFTELAPGESCELRVQLVPAELGARTARLDVVSEAGAVSVPLNALGLAAGDLVLAPAAGSFKDFGGARVGSSFESTFSVSNPTDVPSGPLTFMVNRPEFQLFAPLPGDCVPGSTSLIGGQSCTVRVAFTPTERGPVEATLTGASEGVGAVSVTLSGRGLVPAALSASAPTVDFGAVVLASSARRSVRFENAGDEPLTLAGARLAPENAEGFSILSSDCGAGAVLAGGASCRVELEYRPLRFGEEMVAELVVEGTEAGQVQSLGLRGIGLEPGALTVAASTAGDEDFGAVVVGGSSERVFQIQNPGSQLSGVLDFSVSEGFELVLPPGEGECVSGVTSLVDGQTCSARVRFAPTRRDPFDGSLTVVSPLAGAAALQLSGRGIVPASVRVERELDFGLVLTGASGQRTLSIENAGDEPLPPPSFELTGSVPAQVAAFSFESTCAAPLALGERCDVNLAFEPTDAVAHAVTLEVAAATSRSRVLLLGEAEVPGSLVIAAAADSSADFGDVPVNTSVTRSFTLSNPSQLPLGSVAIVSDNRRFEPVEGDCNPADSAGMVGGASCTFSMTFTPDDNLPQVANLSVQSSGAGRAGLQVSGRGRFPAVLAATGNRDLGRANIGAEGSTAAQSEFRWTVNNQGDLPTGALALEQSNGAEFQVLDDACTSSAVPGGSSCEMTIRFVPGEAGPRRGSIVVSDPDSGSAVTLELTGLGVQLADLGASCLNAECAEGTCTRGVCCDVPCDRTCQVCSAEGRCIDQSNGEACGNGAVCFGVDECKLPAGRACSPNGGDAQCGSGNCERRLGGTGPGDRICCLDDCGDGLQCNAQNRCQAPALGEGEACGAPGQAACAAGLVCKTCLDGGRRCEPAGECCGGCPANAPACDTTAGVCRQCVQAADCPPGGTGTFRSCTNFTCVYGCSTQEGFKECNGSCIPNNQCCNCTGSCQTCINGTCAPVPAGQVGRCTGGQVCNQNGQCAFVNVGLGQACNVQANNCSVGTCVATPQGAVCSCTGNTPNACGNQCVNLQSDPANCGSCNSSCGGQTCSGGQCTCPPGQEFVPGVGCRLSDGQECTPNQGVPCRNGCNAFFPDCDGDGFAPANAASITRCGPVPPSGAPAGCANGRFVPADSAGRVDCCDLSEQWRPGAPFARLESSSLHEACGSTHDYDCDGILELEFPPGEANCENRNVVNCAAGSVTDTVAIMNLLGRDPRVQADLPFICSSSSAVYVTCEVVNGMCTGRGATAPRCR